MKLDDLFGKKDALQPASTVASLGENESFIFRLTMLPRKCVYATPGFSIVV